MQEETSFLGVPCLTLRENTERPITVSQGTNQLIGRDISLLKSEVRRILAGDTKKASPIPLWEGHAADRIAQVVVRGKHLL
jgi:UDP-N-acetylglucosamine 2-epimerase (non-hydrolysing)